MQDGALARALGRVLAHELGHVLLAAPHHARTGLMRRSFAPNDLAAPDRMPFRLTSNDVGEAVPDTRELTRISDAQEATATIDSRLAQVVKVFCGFSFGEIAAMQDLSERTVQRDWEKARICLHQTMAGSAT